MGSIRIERYAVCPECDGKVGALDHLVGEAIREVGPWFCDGCGRGWRLRTNGRDVCDMELDAARSWVPVTVTLVLPPQKEAVVLTLHAHTFVTPGQDLARHSRYFYDEHTCPTNWLRDVAEIRIGDNADPHGLFEFKKIRHGHLERDHATGALKHPVAVEEA